MNASSLQSSRTQFGGVADAHGSNAVRATVAAAIALWLALVITLGAAQAFVTPIGTVPIRIVLGVLVPVAVFLTVYAASALFRNFVLSTNLGLITAVQSWRFAGIGFLALFTHGVLPGVFAWPAGLGDMAIGITAPWLALVLIRRPEFAASRTFIGWNLLGMLDLVAAVGIGGLNSSLATSSITTAPMAQMPLVLVPAFLVPLFLIMHLTALFQARALRIHGAAQRDCRHSLLHD
jgi:hypothetical protein